MKLNKIFWWTIAILWSIPEFTYMVITKEPSKIARFLFEKLGL
jgi:hypothetical protein